MLDFEGIRRLLPQGYPFIFVDRVLEFEANRRIVCLKNVTGSEPFFAGHFPEVAIMPGAIMGEAIAQAAILLFRLSDPVRPDVKGRIFLVGTTRTRFLHPVFPGDTLILTIDAVKVLSSSALVKGQADVAGLTVLKSSITVAAVRPDALTRGRRAAPPEGVAKEASR